ncbi:MAG: phosphoribosyltransferase family protein [Bdellovibrionota bacterium]
MAEAKPDIIIPIPSSAASIRRRGFHHTASIAADLSRQYEVPMLRFALRSVRDRKSQARLSPEKRSQNMFEAFAADRRFVHGKRVLLVDDLLTSGASMNEAARTLKESGAQTVDGVTVARSKYFGRNRVLLQLQKFVDT